MQNSWLHHLLKQDQDFQFFLYYFNDSLKELVSFLNNARSILGHLLMIRNGVT